MAGPVFTRTGARAASASAATLTPALPAVDGASGLLVCVVQSKNNATHATLTSGWTKLGATINSGASFCASIFTAPEGSAAPVITWTGSVACAAQVFYYADPQNTVDTTLGASGSNTGATSAHSRTGIATTRANSLVIYVDAAAANTALATPSTWTEDADSGSATDAGRTTVGSKSVAVSATNAGNISVTGANAAWVMWQIELMGSNPGPLDYSESEFGVWENPPNHNAVFSAAEFGVWENPPNNNVSFSAAESGAWLIPNDNLLKFSSLEAGAWLVPVPANTRRRHLLFASL
jgi:hypothetical protein